MLSSCTLMACRGAPRVDAPLSGASDWYCANAWPTGTLPEGRGGPGSGEGLRNHPAPLTWAPLARWVAAWTWVAQARVRPQPLTRLLNWKAGLRMLPTPEMVPATQLGGEDKTGEPVSSAQNGTGHRANAQ